MLSTDNRKIVVNISKKDQESEGQDQTCKASERFSFVIADRPKIPRPRKRSIALILTEKWSNISIV